MSDELFPEISAQRPPTAEAPESENIWYLGLDVGTSGLSAALLNRESGEVYPIYWLAAEPSASGSPVERSFRLPATAYRSPDSGEWFAAGAGSQTGETGLWLSGFKPYLKVGLIGSREGAQPSRWEPIVQWSDRESIPLSWVQSAGEALLATLKPPVRGGESSIASGVSAEGLDRAAFRAAMGQLAGAIVSYPASWPDSYRFNLTEAILAAGLVERPGQIAFVEEAIAALLSVLPSAAGSALRLPGSSLSQQLNFFNSHAPGATLVICSGATATELAIASVPENLEELSHSDLAFRSFPYAGDAIDQDILCQMLLSPPEKNLNYEADLQPSDLLLHAPENWPRAGEPDLSKRYRFQQLCRASSIGPSLLETVQYLKVSLQYRERLALEVGSRRLVFSRRDLESRVFLPFVQRLNRELNALLAQTGVPVQGINRAICTGGTASVGAIARWLRQKLPNATIVQDTYPSDRPPACSRVAYGLAAVPLHPRVLDTYRQQYSDAFLLAEILQIGRAKLSLPEGNRSFSLEEILRLLERRGINTSAVSERIGRCLKGHLPAFLQPASDDRLLLSAEFKENPDYLALSATPLFSPQQQTYRVNPPQFHRLSHYFSDLMARSYQRLDEPLMVELAQRFGTRP